MVLVDSAQLYAGLILFSFLKLSISNFIVEKFDIHYSMQKFFWMSQWLAKGLISWKLKEDRDLVARDPGLKWQECWRKADGASFPLVLEEGLGTRLV